MPPVATSGERARSLTRVTPLWSRRRTATFSICMACVRRLSVPDNALTGPPRSVCLCRSGLPRLTLNAPCCSILW